MSKHIEELYAKVYADPEDLPMRLVLADALQEIDDPRGELIALQHVRAGTGRDASKRERELIKKHMTHLLGRLDPAVLRSESVAFDMGFVSRCTYRHHAKARERTGARDWSTVQWLDIGQDTASVLPLLKSEPIRRWLRTAWRVRIADFVELATPNPSLSYAWKEMCLVGTSSDDELIASGFETMHETTMPSLNRILLQARRWLTLFSGAAGAPALMRVLESQLASRLERLVFIELRAPPTYPRPAGGAASWSHALLDAVPVFMSKTDVGPKRLVLASGAGRITIHRGQKSPTGESRGGGRVDVQLVVGGGLAISEVLGRFLRHSVRALVVIGHTHSSNDVRLLRDAASRLGIEATVQEPSQ